jgi:UDPglucose 6-dehydrogenase
MRVCVIGTGYVGLVTGACLAHVGHHVICVDNNEEKVKLMQSGQSPIFEPGLSDIIKAAIQSKRLSSPPDLAAGVAHGQILFIAVGTPALPNGESDTRYVEAVARGIGSHLSSDYKVIVNKSTVPIGSGDWVRMLIMEGFAEQRATLNTAVLAGAGATEDLVTRKVLSPDPAFDVVSNPEFLREGCAVDDTFNPDRIVLGSTSKKAIALMQELYAPIVSREYAIDKTLPPVPVVVTDLSSAEMIKYAANAFLATKISFINEVANICERVGADVVEVAKGIGLDTRVGNKFLQAGIGWGGSCFPKDVSALIHTADDYGYEAHLAESCRQCQPATAHYRDRKTPASAENPQRQNGWAAGSYLKPDTDDLRDAPALNIIEQLARLGTKVKAYDPIISQTGMRHGLSDVIVETDAERLADGCDALVLVTDWKQFRELDYAKMASLMHAPVMIDGRNFLDRKALEQAGFRYVGVGRG